MVPQRVLLVDDQAAALHLLRRSLLRAWPSCQVDVAGSTAQAQPLLHRNCYDAVVTDYFLGDGTGLEIAREARLQLPLATIVLTSASSEALAAAEESARAWGIGLLAKPIEFGRLVHTLTAEVVAP